MKSLSLSALMLSMLLASTANAEDAETELFIYRSNVMEASSTHLKALQAYVKGKLPIEKHIPSHVDALLALSSMYQDLFPAGEQHPDSEALPMIWNDPRGFQNAIKYNRKRIEALKQVDPSDIKTLKRAVNEVRMSCGDCHYYFRER